ncbi:hypothetical protein [Pararobbsia alpina]
MMGVVIGSVGSGKNATGVNANGMTRGTIAAGIEMIGVTTINAGSSKVTGITAVKTTVGEVTINANRTDWCVRRA